MSSPVGHSLAGYIVATFTSGKSVKKNIGAAILFVFIANVPDLDFIPGIVVGTPNLYHHGISHSFGAGALFSLVLALIINCKKRQYIKRNFLLFFGTFSSHLLLDYISLDGRSPAGIPILWPLSREYFFSPYPILPPVSHSGLDNATIGQFLNGVFSFHNLNVIFLETLLMLPVLVIAVVINLRRKQNVKAK